MNKKIYRYQATAAALVLGVFTTSCSSMSDETQTRTQGTTAGVLIGAGLGALAGLAIGGNTESVLTGLSVGAAAGAAAGFVWGDSIVKQKRAYATTEQYVNANNQQLANRINQTKQYNQQLRNQVNSLNAQNKQLSAAKQAEAKAKIKANAREGITAIDQDIANAKAARADATGNELAKLDNNIAALQKEKASLTSELAKL